MPIGDYNPAPKPSHKRNKPVARQRGAITPKVRQQLHERSGGLCERCGRYANLQAAHITRRWRLERTTLEDLIHLCLACHTWADNTREGREWLKEIEEIRSRG